MNKFFLSAATLFLFVVSYSQNAIKPCGTVEAEQKLLAEHPELIEQVRQNAEQLEKHTREFTEKKAGTVYVVPVVFHVLHDYGQENISDAQIFDAMKILNDDFRKKNADTTDIVPSFQSIAADCEIEFRLAQKDPNGNCTNGIDRIWSNYTYAGSDEAKLNIWPRNKYMNIWVVKNITDPAGAAGYTYTPLFSPSNIDGIVVIHSYVGSIGTSSVGTSRTLSHEVGHWLNLLHTWGSTNDPGVSCGNDNVNDTPITKGHYSTCPLSDQTCTAGVIENVQNYMEYSYCANMFTQGQKARMRSAITSSTAGRNNLWTTGNLAATGTDVTTPIFCAAAFNLYPTVVCAGTTVQFADESINATPTSWNWTFDGGSPATSSVQNPSVTYDIPGTYDVSLTASDGDSTYTKTKNSYITVLSKPGKFVPFAESFEFSTFPNDDWLINNSDSTAYKWDLFAGAAYSGSKCLKMNNYGNDTIEKDDLISSTIDLSNLTSATVTFKVAYVQKNSNTNDKLTAYISTNCGQSWSPRFSKYGALLATFSAQTTAFTPSSTAVWAEYSFNLTSSSMTENARLKFTFECDGGNNLYLDDINITGAYNPVPLLVSPANNAINQDKNTILDWKAAGNVDSYEYQIDVYSAFNSGNLITGTTQFLTLSPDSTDTEVLAANLSVSTKYYWRVRSITSGTPSAWSAVWNFKVSDNGVGISETEEFGFQIYPNPTNGKIEIRNWKVENSAVEIYNILGKEIYSSTLTLTSPLIDFSNHPSGIYFIKLSSGEKSQVKKLVINKL